MCVVGERGDLSLMKRVNLIKVKHLNECLLGVAGY